MGNPIPAIGYPQDDSLLWQRPPSPRYCTINLVRPAHQGCSSTHLWELLNETTLETKVHQYCFSYLFSSVSVWVIPQKWFFGTTSTVRCLFLLTFASIPVMLLESENRCSYFHFVVQLRCCSVVCRKYLQVQPLSYVSLNELSTVT